MKDIFKAAGIALIVALVIGVAVYFDYKAYTYRFPNVPMWTYFFRGGHR